MDVARDYLSRLRSRCGEDTELYQEFLRIMRDFKHGNINARVVISQVAELFKGNSGLIAEFNNFLPEELRLQVPQTDCEYAATYIKKVKELAPDIYADFLTLLSKYQEGEKTASEVKNKVTSLLSSYPDLLREFALFLPELSSDNSTMQQGYQGNGSHNNTEDLDNFNNSTVNDKSEFLSYLASTISSTVSCEPPKVVTRKGPVDASYNLTVIPELDRLLEQQKRHLNKVETTKEKNGFSTETSDNPEIRSQSYQHYYYSQEDLSMWESDYRIFEEVYVAMGDNKRYYSDFLKLIYLYTRGVLTVVETLLALECFFPMDSGDLPYEVKRMIVQREAARRKYSYFCCNFAQLDYSKCARNGNSYLHLPDDYPIAICTGRIDSDRQNLNDNWVSIPQGSEDFSFKHMRKNVYEENLFKCEDERFELDMVIENNRSTIHILEPIAEQISKLSIEEKKRFKLKNPPFSIIHLKAISRIYGDNGSEILELLKRSPYSCIPVILNRLKQKDEEWTHARHLMNQGVWRDIQTKNYFKSFDHRSFYFRQSDKKNTNVKGFLSEVSKLYLQRRGFDLGTSSPCTTVIPPKSIDSTSPITSSERYQNISTTYRKESNGWSIAPEFAHTMSDIEVHKEVIELISFTIYRQASGPAIGSKARNFLQRFVRSLFLQMNYNVDNDLLTLKQLQSEGSTFQTSVTSNCQNNSCSNSSNSFSNTHLSNNSDKQMLTVEAYVNAVTEGHNNNLIPFTGNNSRGRRLTRNHSKKSSSIQSSNNGDQHVPLINIKPPTIEDGVIDGEESNICKTIDNTSGTSDNNTDNNSTNRQDNHANLETANNNVDLNSIFQSFTTSYDCRGGLKYLWSDHCKVNWHSSNLSPDWFEPSTNGNRTVFTDDTFGIEVNDHNEISEDNKSATIVNKDGMSNSIVQNLNVNKGKGSLFRPTSLVRYIMGNDHICCFLRYYQVIYERLQRAKATIEQREKNPQPFQRWSPNGPDVPRPTYKQVIWCCFGLLSGELELGLFEDICRDAMGNDSYWLGTIDKVLLGISKVIVHIVNDLATCRLLAMNLVYRDTIFDHYRKLEEFIAACRSLLPTVQSSFYIITWSPCEYLLKIRMRQLDDYHLTFLPFISNTKSNNLSNNEVDQCQGTDMIEETLIPPKKYLLGAEDDIEYGVAIDLTNDIELLQQILVHQLTSINDDPTMRNSLPLEQISEADNENISSVLSSNPVSFFVYMEQTFVKPLLFCSMNMKYIAKLAASSQWLGFLPDNSHRDIARSPSVSRDAVTNTSVSVTRPAESKRSSRRTLMVNDMPNPTDEDKGQWSEESIESNSRAMSNTNRRGTVGRKRTRGMPSDITTEIDDIDIRVTRRRSGNTTRGFRRN
ncbi:transcriptional regulatory protein SIN3, putative [Cryptosporidium muris RN66]|uniref:Transcriptional regulatory protein SIN3, putative n=1 Tax=Cryptosporidium muris (strain RN66) TaxID=441375 RepID=B6A9J0_CRYMR|nr:transcriptional regulatory protein SIN3, putative [Cryptosporidium muris RN66]EEA04881.1 transcriptional regulatory protein SIN3, putative [Cryptosporidium muris RN66]|eukprot:XP_002139230.1 transcriptional regulatory protein SIN3 [Cryptosporidium muris RN66]